MDDTGRTDTGDAPEIDAEWLVNQIAHALRNPIFAALVQAETLSLKAASVEPIARTGRSLHAQLQRLEEAIQEMLLYGRPAPVKRRTVAVARLLDEIAAAHRSGERGEAARIEIEGAVEGLEAEWDPDAVRIVLDRLLANAVQHTEEPHDIRLEVRAEDSRIEIAVHDRGEGIPENIRDRIFLPFVPQHRGRPGLGLAVARKFAEAMDGSLVVESEVDEGTVARLRLPR